MKQNPLLLLAVALLLLYACKNEEAPAPRPITPCDTARIFSVAVHNIMIRNCTDRGCHPGGRSPAVANFSTIAKLKEYISNHRSTWDQRVTGPQADMPPGRFPDLTQETKDSIACWISKGMPDN